MKHLKRIASVLLALVMVLSMAAVTAFAEDEKGSITINNIAGDSAGSDTVYEIYRLLDLESYDVDSNVYSYKVNADWADFFKTDEAKVYFKVDEQNYATWVGEDTSRERAGKFAQIALAYAQENNIEPVQSSAEGHMHAFTNSSNQPAGKFSDLALGYYLVDSNVGALCGLTTTNADASINAKNGQPTIDKQVKEDLSGNWGESSSADIGQIIEYRTTIKVHAGAENYILHDTMSEGLDFVKVDKVEHVVSGGTTEVAEEGTDYTVKTPGTETGEGVVPCTFEVVFSKDFCDHLNNNDEVIVYYTAKLNDKAIVAGEGNANTTSLQFGENHYTTEDNTKTYTYAFDLVKTDGQNKLIDGAQFRIYDAATGGNEVFVKAVLDESNNVVKYIRDASATSGDPIIVKDGKVRVEGLDNGTYYLDETVTPEGYNQLAGRESFTISDANKDAVFNNGNFSVNSGVQVVNKSGTMLPETGGIGTTIFYIVGGVLVVGAVVLLITKRRMTR